VVTNAGATDIAKTTRLSPGLNLYFRGRRATITIAKKNGKNACKLKVHEPNPPLGAQKPKSDPAKLCPHAPYVVFIVSKVQYTVKMMHKAKPIAIALGVIPLVTIPVKNSPSDAGCPPHYLKLAVSMHA